LSTWVTGCSESDSPAPIGHSPADSAAGAGTATVGVTVASTSGSGAGGASFDAATAAGGASGAGGAQAIADAAESPESQPPADAGGGALDAGGGAPDAGDGATRTCQQAAFCESFEDVASGSPPSPAIWTRTSNDVLVDSTRAALGGKRSLHIPPMVSGAKFIRENKTVATLGPTFYGRVYFWIDRQPVEKPATLYHWTLLEADDGPSVNAGTALRLGGHIEASGTNWLRFNFETHGNPGETGLSDQNLTVSTQRWYCVEFYYSMPNNEARFWLDGVEDPNLHWKGPMGAYTFPAAVAWMSFGWAEYQVATTPWEIWIDEIAMDPKKIGCN